MVPKPGKFQFAIDRGGTFTDVFARCPDGNTKVLKLLSEDPQHYKDAPTEGIRRILQEFNTVTGAGLNQENLFLKRIELSLIRKQIKELATFLPNVVLALNQDEISLVHHCVGVLLQGDICGITTLADRYNKTGSGGIYKLTATFNAYIGALIEIIQYYGGDILKYRGPEFRAIWKVLSDDCLFEVLHEALVCGLVIIRNLNYFLTEVNVPLSVRLSISCGNFCFSVVGEGNTKQGIIIGDAVAHIPTGSRLGVVISPGAWSHMLQDRYIITKLEDGNVEVSSVSYKPNEEDKKKYYDLKQIAVAKLIEQHLNHRILLNAEKTFESHMTDSQITEQFMRVLPPREQIKYALKHWIVDELRPFIIKNVQCQVDEGQPVQYLTEFRKLTILSIKIQTYSYTDSSMTVVLDDIFQEICNVCVKAMGLVHQFHIRDSITCLVLFGLRGVKHEAESQLALKCAYILKVSLRNRETIKTVTCGVAHGLVYCGVVGHPLRREYVVIGYAVEHMNVLTSKYNDKVICDYATFRSSKLSAFYFEILIEGEYEFEDIFEFNEAFEAVTEKITEKPLIGRNSEVNFIRDLVFNPEKVKKYGICIFGNECLGKTAILLECLRRFQKSESVIAVSIELTASVRNPYFCISHIYRQLYDAIALVNGPDLSNIINLPMELLQDYDKVFTAENDIALMKYNILKRFRVVTEISNKIPVFFIDNIDHIDMQSYEIIDIIIKEGNIRLISTAVYSKKQYWDLQHKMSLNDSIKMLELAPLKAHAVPCIACQFVGSNGISESIIKLLLRSCNGYPGYILICLLRLLSNGSIRLKFLNSEDPEVKKFIFADNSVETEEVFKYEPRNDTTDRKHGKILSVLEFTSKFQAKKTEVTLTAISLDLFDSFSTFEQMVVKTGAVLGNLFTRTLLVVALKYPTEANLVPIIQHLFEVEVFECGARLLYGEHIDSEKLCCRCCFDFDFFALESRKGVPKYAFCKIIHFRNKNIKDVAYNLLPGNQRIELHLLCTEILEYSHHQCPRCMRDPCTNFINLYKFKEIMEYCKNPNAFNYVRTNGQADHIDNMKQVIKSNIREIDEGFQTGENEIEEPWKRRFLGMKFCHCFEILSRVNYDLIYHSKKAAHWPKFAFFTTQYGMLLIFQLDYTNAITVLNQAREVCLMDAGLSTAPFSETFRKLHIGKIETHLAKCCLELRMLKAARNHLAIALRQYNIPAVALERKAYKPLLTRSFLVNAKRIKGKGYKNAGAKYDTGLCLAYCAKLFAFEGKWNLSRLTSLYSMHLLKGANPNIPILFDVYCSALEIYNYSGDMHTCERLQRYLVRELQAVFAFNYTPYLYGIKILLNNLFLVSCISGNLSHALRLGYRVLDIHFKLYGQHVHLSIVGWLVLLLMLQYRVKDCITATKIFLESSIAGYCRVNYFGMVLRFYLKTGFYIEPIDNILEFANEYFRVNPNDLGWQCLELRVLLAIYYIRKYKVNKATEWYVTCPFTRQNIREQQPAKTLLAAVEYNIYYLICCKREKKTNLSEQEKEIKRLLNLLKENVKIFKIFRPNYLCLLAWYEKTKKRHINNVDKLLSDAFAIAEEQGNILYQCYVAQLRNVWMYWSNGHDNSPKLPYVQFEEATNFSLSELAQMMHALPLD